MKLLTNYLVFLNFLLGMISMFGVTCHFYNKTPFEMIINLDIPFSSDKEIRLPAGSQEIYNTGIIPLRSYVVHALICKTVEKTEQKILIHESNQMKFSNLRCSLFIEPVVACDNRQQREKGLKISSVKFWVASGRPEYGLEVAV